MWSKPKLPVEGSTRAFLYEGSGSGRKTGSLIIRKAAFEGAERGRETFAARGLILLYDGGDGAVQLGKMGTPVASSNFLQRGLHINIKVEYSLEGAWRWYCDRATDVVLARAFSTAWWLVS